MTQKLPKNNYTRLAPGIIHIILVIIVLIIGGVVLVATLIPFSKRQNALAQVGQKAPDFELVDFNGNQVKLSDFENKPIVIEFWGNRWASLEELLILQEIQQDFPQVVFLGIHFNDSRPENPKRAKFLIGNNLKITFNQLEDTENKVYDLYNFSSSQEPLIYFVDKNAIITERFSNFKTKEQIQEQIQKLLL